MKTKLLALLLMLAMVVSVLASCGGNDGEGEGGEGTGEGEGGGDTLEKIAADKWAAAFDVSNATVVIAAGDETFKIWSVDGDYYTENEDGAFENFPEAEYMLAVFDAFAAEDIYNAVAIVAEGKYTAASIEVEEDASITNVEVVLVEGKVSTIKYTAENVTATYTVTDIGTTKAPSHDRTKEYYWTAADAKSLLIEMNLHSSGNEMLAYTRRYMAGIAGEGETLNTRLDQLVADRNTAAYGATKLTVNYAFHEDGVYGWSGYHTPISNAIATPTEDTADIYCGFAYDLGTNSCKGDFANLMGTTRGEGNNYFTFNEDNYNAEYDDEGYFYELMRSISPVDDKMYVYASNYTIDVIRAIYCIPVSVNLLNSLKLNKLAEQDANFKWDADEDGNWNIDDFYDIVFTNKFTYDVLGAMGGAAYVNASGAANPGYGDTLGFTFDTAMGLPAAGIMYSNDIELFVKSYDAEGNPVFTTPATNEAFLTLVNEFGAVFNVTGNIINGDFKGAGYTKAMVAIRDRFSQSKILFGGVVNIGTLDYAEYQEMDGGFGIVPIPLVEAGKDYVAAIHNLARVMGIAKSSANFEQASAFLDYQALNSDEVNATYYSLLQYDTVGGEQYNIATLNLLRDSLGDNKNQYLENQVRNQPDIKATVTVDAWGGFFRRTSFDAEELRAKYEACVANKNKALAMLVDIYQGFTN